MSGFSRTVSVTELSWFVIGLMVIVPPLVLLVAYPFWRDSQPILGNIAGTASSWLGPDLILGVGRARSAVARVHGRRLLLLSDADLVLALCDLRVHRAVRGVRALHASLSVEQRIRRSGYDPEWR